MGRRSKKVQTSRRQQRFEADAARPIISGYCNRHGVSIRGNNCDFHWIFDYNKDRIDWWPSTGKTVINQNYKEPQTRLGSDGILQLMEEIWGLEIQPDEISQQFISMFSDFK